MMFELFAGLARVSGSQPLVQQDVSVIQKGRAARRRRGGSKNEKAPDGQRERETSGVCVVIRLSDVKGGGGSYQGRAATFPLKNNPSLDER